MLKLYLLLAHILTPIKMVKVMYSIASILIVFLILFITVCSSTTRKDTTALLATLNLQHQVQDENNQYSVGQGTNSIENQLRYQANKQIVTQWISPRLIDNLRQSEEQWLNNKHFLALGIQAEVTDVYQYLNSARTYS